MARMILLFFVRREQKRYEERDLVWCVFYDVHGRPCRIPDTSEFLKWVAIKLLKTALLPSCFARRLARKAPLFIL